MIKRSAIITLLLPVVMIGCASTGPAPTPVDTRASEEVVELLYEQYDSWKGVRYREGGLSRKGIDCSGYVHLTFRDKFHRDIPRSTDLLASTGVQINPAQMRAGDLVFFRIGRKKRHVGIYLDEGTFMHASSSRGVMISRLRSPYWSESFWMARRLN